MQALIRAAFRTGIVLVIGGAGYVPLILLTIWSGAYLYDCVNELLSGGGALEYSYQSRDGRVLVRASGYTVSLPTLTGAIYRVSVVGPRDEVVGGAKRIDIKWSWRSLDLRLAEVALDVERLPSGEISLARLLPARRGPPSQLPYSVEVVNASIRYRDRLAPGSKPVTIRVARMRADGYGERLVGGIEASADGVGRVPVRLTRSPQGLALWTKLRRAELAPLLGLATALVGQRRLGEYGPVSASSLVLDGEVEIWLPNRGAVKWGGYAEGRFAGLRLGSIVQSAFGSAKIGGDARSGRIVADLVEPRRSASFAGTIVWEPEVFLSGAVRATSASKGTVWRPLAQLLPRELEYRRLRGSGNLEYREKSGFRIDAALESAAAIWSNEEFEGASCVLRLDSKQVLLGDLKAAWMGEPVHGFVGITFSSGQIAGGAALASADLGRIAARLGANDARGRISGTALISGTTAKPVVTIDAHGVLAADRPREGRYAYLGPFDIRGELKWPKFEVLRAAVTSENGTAMCTGALDLEQKRIALEVRAGGIDLSALDLDLDGVGFLQARVGGTFDRPVATGAAQLYALDVLDWQIPVVSASLEWRDEILTARDISVSVGALDAGGEATWNSRTDALSASLSANNVQLSDWTDGVVAGLATVQKLEVTGTASDPIASGRLTVRNMAVAGYTLDSVELAFAGDRNGVGAEKITAKAGEGTITGSGGYRFESKQWEADLQFEDVELSRVSLGDAPVALDGRLDGAAHVSGTAGAAENGAISARIENLQINETLIGSGEVSAQADGAVWEGSANIGQLERYIATDDLRLDAEARTLSVSIDVSRFLLQDLTSIFHKQVGELSDSWRKVVNTVQGQISARILVSGSFSDVNLDIPELQIGRLAVNDRQAGLIQADVSRRNGEWTVGRATWVEENSRLALEGSIIEDGAIRLQGTLSRFDLSWLPTLMEEFPALYGEVDATFTVGGTTESPSVEGAARALSLGVAKSDRPTSPLPLSVALERFSLHDRQLVAKGVAAYRGLEADIEASGSLDAFVDPESLAPSAPTPELQVGLELRRQEIEGLSLPEVDPEKTQAHLSGQVVARQRPGELSFHGQVSIAGERFGLTRFDTHLLNPKLTASFEGTDVEINGSATSSNGGTVKLTALRARLPSALPDSRGLSEFLAQIPVSGVAEVESFRCVEDPRSRLYRTDCVLAGSLRVGGVAREPAISGSLQMVKGNVSLPTEFGGSDRTVPLEVNPKFENIVLGLGDGVTVRSGVAELSIQGSGVLRGSLSAPDLRFPMTVTGGVIKLPTVTLRLEDQGKLDLSYQSVQGTPAVHLDADLQGKAYVTARRLNDLERYEITVAVTGDLAQEDGMRLRATSDPPDLTESQILGLLGKQDLIEALDASTLLRGSGLQAPLYTFLVPRLTEPVTDEIARIFKLDYLNLEYNPFEQVTLSASKTLGKGLSLQLRRQVSSLWSGRARYEVKLVWRPPTRNPLLSRVRFSLGFDQQRPWKLSVDYAIRF